jgi:hypothetical protein
MSNIGSLTGRGTVNTAEPASEGPAGASANGVSGGMSQGLELALKITDREVIAELERIPAGTERERFALAALRVGVLALRTASGQLDSAAVREAGARMLGELREALNAHAVEVKSEVTSFLGTYFDPKTGLVQRRIEELVKPDGDLARILLEHVGADDSVMARALAERIGESSPLFKLLSPTEKNGLIASLEAYIRGVFEEQRKAIVGEFSLDNKDSALSRFLDLLVVKNGELASHLSDRIDDAVGELSLDRPDSALSRLVAGVDKAQQKIAAEFSLDNDESGLNKLKTMLSETKGAIESSLTLDDKGSALSRLREEMLEAVGKIAQGNTDFHAEMRGALAELRARKEEAQRSTIHGIAFEEQVGGVLAGLVQRVGDLCEATGNSAGVIQYNKKGDFVVTLGPESHAPGQKVVWGAKEDKSYNISAALSEIAEARKNREAEVGVFVFSAKAAPAGLEPFARYANDFIIVWDPENPATDLLVKSTFSVSRCILTRKAAVSQETAKALAEIVEAARSVERQVKYIEEFKKKGDIIKNHGKEIAHRAELMIEDLGQQVNRLDRMVQALRADSDQGA